MRKVLSVFVAVCLVLSLFTGIFVSMPSARADITEGDYIYTIVNSATATITGYRGVAGIITIPDLLGGYPVTSIGYRVFGSHTELVGVTIPNSVMSIGFEAFSLCEGLASVTIGSGVTSIGYGAFSVCTSLSTVYFLGNAPLMSADVFLAPGSKTVYYTSGTTGWTDPWYGCPTAIKYDKVTIVLQIENAMFTVNGASKTLDSPPVIKNDRTLVPIRTIIEALAGTVGWDATTKKATVTLGKKAITLWIGKSAATVNGVNTLIDSTNAKVVPEIISGRTMLPLRFVTQNLGCAVVWTAATKTITITSTP